MDNSVFNPEEQHDNVSNKIVAGLERISEVFKVMLWDKAKVVGLSPIQIQIIIFVGYHEPSLCNVSHLAEEFNVTKPTISDAIKILDKKGMINKDYLPSDNRRYNISLSELGIKLLEETQDFADPMRMEVEKFSDHELEDMYKTLSDLIYKLNQSGILSVQRICYGCKYFQKTGYVNYCKLLQKKLYSEDIRIDCPEFIEIDED